MSDTLTSLEKELVERTARENWPGFRIDGLHVIKRENTGAGRYVHLKDDREQDLPDGTYSAEGQMIEMAGVRNGLGFAIDVSASRINYVELFTFGNEDWDGIERQWRIV
jgi:hypothetical protein